MVTRTVSANGIAIHVREAGTGPAVLLLHGWPHTGLVWRDVLTDLAADHHVIAPDLRGLGATEVTERGFDLHTLADDAVALLDALGVEDVALVAGIDLGAPVAFMTAVRHAGRVRRLAVMESLLGTLPGAGAFLAGGPPWWFGFHAVPELPEALLAGRSDTYVDFFLRAGTFDGTGPDAQLRDAILAAYRDPARLHAGFEHYRALPANAELIARAAATPVPQPVLALGGNVVGPALHGQLEAIAPDLQGTIVEQAGHIIPVDAPADLAARLRAFINASWIQSIPQVGA